METIHTCNWVRTTDLETGKIGVWVWLCEQGDFFGHLEDAIKHIVKNQFIVK